MGAVIAAVSKYRVDNVPLLLQPLFMLYGFGVGLAQFAYSCLIHWTCRIRYSTAPRPFSRLARNE